ncbi:hypothetical protein F5Y10DRAFT_267145 [Nemania abortiva]|nr:hypothetical protein F5Y10DRAFT_267145 [Nemania abortiva]
MASPSKNKTNFKSYETMTRLLAAVIATGKPKLDYAELARHVGGGATKDAVDHRLRPIKQLAKMQAACLKKGQDPVELPVDKGEIQKLFGESTPAGIEWQFREIKSLGKAQMQAVEKGDNPAALLPAGTPSAGRGKGAGARTPGSGGIAKTPGTATRGRKRKVPATLVPLDSSDENGENDGNDDSDCDIVDTPSKRPAKRPKTTAATTPSKKANGSVTTPAVTYAKNAAAVPATTAATTVAPIPHLSIFGGDARGPTVMQSAEAFDDEIQMNTTHVAQHHAPAAKSVTAKIKKEFMTNAINAGSFGEEDNFEDGEI